MNEEEKIEIRCNVDAATRDMLIAMATQDKSHPSQFADYVGDLIKTVITK